MGTRFVGKLVHNLYKYLITGCIPETNIVLYITVIEKSSYLKNKNNIRNMAKMSKLLFSFHLVLDVLFRDRD